jgi:hypothetical protein
MAQTGYTPISIYYSATATNTPTAGNLVAGELAINTADGKLFYKDSVGVVQVIGTKGGVGSSTTTQVLYNSSGLVVGSANLTFDGTTLTANALKSATLGSPSATALTLQSAGTTAVTIDTSQNVGIGTASPANKLEVVGSTNAAFGMNVSNTNVGTSAQARTLYTSSSNTFIVGSSNDTGLGGGGFFYQVSAVPITFFTNSTERMRITSGGAVLIGTTSATNTFVASSASGGTAVAQIINTSSSGNVISVASTLQSNGNNTSSAHYQGNTTGVGNWYLFGNGTSSYSSDERLKKNIETTRSGYLEDLCKLRVVKYNWRLDEEGKNKELGLIAQEVEQVFPKLVQDDLNPVSQDDKTIYKQLKQSVLPFMLLKAIQELNSKVDAQAAEIATLKAK